MTDVGSLTPHIVDCLADCDALVVEANHDAALLAQSRYPASLKQRVGGRFGHLENEVAAELLARIGQRRGGLGHLQHLVGAHLSEENNRPDIALAALARVAGNALERIELADQVNGLGWRSLS
jgi:phosphoribosyl 1,2-cyclic phosphodiesterase